MNPLAMVIYQEKPHIRCIRLMYRDGNALAIHNIVKKEVNLTGKQSQRMPNSQL